MDGRAPEEMKTGGHRSSYLLPALCIALGLATVGAGSPPGKKKLTVENIMELLSGGVAVQRVTYLVQERGVDFQLDSRLEQAFRDAGADRSLILSLQGQPIAPGMVPALEQTVETPANQQAPAPQAEIPISSKPAPATKPASPTRGEKILAGLQIRSHPGDASIFVDDEAKGKTDPEDGHLEIIPLKPGKHRLRATRDGYQDLEGTVEIAAGEIVETPLWLAKTEPAAPPAPAALSLPAGKKFLARHKHLAIAGVSGGGYCQGWIIVNVGYVRYLSGDNTHNYLMNTSEIRDAKAGSGGASLLIKLDFGRKYEFVAVDEKGKEVSPGPILAEIRYSMGQ